MIQVPRAADAPRSRSRRVLLLVGGLALAGVIAAVKIGVHAGGKPHALKTMTVPVTAATVSRQAMPLDLLVSGTVVPYASVSVRALVSGELDRVGFAQGKPVTKGQLLFGIDPRPYREALDQALAGAAKDSAQVGQLTANLARDEAERANNDQEAHRYAALLQEGFVSREQADQYRSTAQASDATVAADRAALAAARATVLADQAGVQTARINLGYTQIMAPVSGLAGDLLVDPGNLIKANDTNPLVTINQLQPIYVSFPLQEAQFDLARKYTRRGEIAVQAAPAANAAAEPALGHLAFTDNAIDATTGNIEARAVFANDDELLWPGSYVRVRIHLADEPGRIVVPKAAVLNGQDGQYVYLIRPDHTVAMQPVAIDREQGGVAIVSSGLAPGQRVVTDGQLQLFDGAHVREVHRGGAAGATKASNSPGKGA
ncbi:MAG: efflux RND transporter periplasmic adaptor subunit [Cyanobacteria bacterium REEB65]|nr:efflux RND transporter periplasmic adaptor subunit [Cyanobacteria bacterium REEB65]